MSGRGATVRSARSARCRTVTSGGASTLCTAVLGLAVFALGAASRAPAQQEDVAADAPEPEWVTPRGAPMGAVAFSPDGEVVASAGHDGEVHLWAAEDGAHLGRLEGHGDEVYDVAFVGDGGRLVSGGYDGRVILWEVEAREPVRSWSAEPWTTDVAVAGSELLFGTVTSRLRRGTLGSDSLSTRETDLYTVSSVAAGPDGELWAAAALEIALLDREGARLEGATLQGHDHLVLSMDFGDGRLVSGSMGGTVRVWDLEAREETRVLEREVPHPMVALSPDGDRVAAGGASLQVWLWDLSQEDAGTRPVGRHDRGVTGVAFSPDGDRLVSTSMDGTVRMWSLPDGGGR